MKLRTLAACLPATIVAGALAISSAQGCVGDDAPAPVTTDGSTPGADTGTTSPDTGTSSGGDAEAGCTKTVCTSGCVDLQSDPANCGACDNDCGGGQCQAGVCQAVAVASGVDEPVSVAVAGNAVFWLRAGALERCPITGCATTSKVTGEGETYPASYTSKVNGRLVATTATDVFWIGRNAPSGNILHVYKCPLAGCAFGTPTDFHQAPSGEQLGQIATQGTNVYFTHKFMGVQTCDGTQQTCPTPPTITGTGGDQEYGLAVDSQRVYYTYTFSAGNGGGLFSCPFGGCGSAPAAMADPAWHIAWFAGTIYINAYGKISSCISTGCSGTPTELATGQEQTAPVAADGTGVYWIKQGNYAADAGASNGEVLMCRLPSCAGGPRVLATGQAAPNSLAVQDGFVYWANRGREGTAKSGSIMRVKR